MTDAIVLSNFRLFCSSCDHREPVEAVTRDMIGRPCPKCAANLLTAEEYASTVMHIAHAEVFNALAGGEPGEYSEPVTIRIVAGRGN